MRKFHFCSLVKLKSHVQNVFACHGYGPCNIFGCVYSCMGTSMHIGNCQPMIDNPNPNPLGYKKETASIPVGMWDSLVSKNVDSRPKKSNKRPSVPCPASAILSLTVKCHGIPFCDTDDNTDETPLELYRGDVTCFVMSRKKEYYSIHCFERSKKELQYITLFNSLLKAPEKIVPLKFIQVIKKGCFYLKRMGTSVFHRKPFAKFW